MKTMARHIGIAASIGVICVGLLWFIDKQVWASSPYPEGASNALRMATWGINTFKVKAAGIALMFLSSVGLAVHHRDNWKIAVICAMCATLVFQCALVAIYILRHGHESYLKYHNELDTALLTLAIPYAVAFFISTRSFLGWSRRQKSSS